MEFWNFSSFSDKIKTNDFPREVILQPRDIRKITLPDRFWTIVNITIGGKSFAIQHYTNVPSRNVFTKLPASLGNLMANIIWHSVCITIHRFCAIRGITKLSWWVYNPSDDLFSPWLFQRAFIHHRIRNTRSFHLVRKSSSTEILAAKSTNNDVSLLW